MSHHLPDPPKRPAQARHRVLPFHEMCELAYQSCIASERRMSAAELAEMFTRMASLDHCHPQEIGRALSIAAELWLADQIMLEQEVAKVAPIYDAAIQRRSPPSMRQEQIDLFQWSKGRAA